MNRMTRNGSFWMGAIGCMVCFVLLQLVSNLPWAKAQALPAESGTKGVTPSSGGVTTGEAPGSGSAARLIPFQAYLTDSNGRPVEGQHGLTFRIYDDPTQGTPQWWETHGNVPVNRGMANVLLGSMTSFGSLTFDQARYVGVSVDGGVEMVPRQQIVAAIYAADADRSREAEHAVNADNAVDANRLGGSPGGFWASSIEIVPVGGVITYFGNPADLPDNWLVCDGSVVNDPSSSLNGKTLPNMSGQFARGPSGSEVAGSVGGQSTHAHSSEPAGSHAHLTPILAIDDPGFSQTWITPGLSFGSAGSADIAAFDLASAAAQTRTYGNGHPASFALTSTTSSHAHTVNSSSNVPTYVALHYIIRIK